MQELDLQYAPIGINPVVHVSQYDVGRQFKLKIYDGSTPYTIPSGTTARIDGLKPDKTAFSYSDAVSVDGNVVTITTKDQMTVLDGIVLCEIRFRNGLDDIGTLNFKIEVEKSPINSDIPISDTEIPAIIDLAQNHMLNAEAWAAGTKDGVPVEDTELQYENNAKYYSDNADISAANALISAGSANASATAAENSATESESWAVGGTGTRTGENTNNSYYWCQKAMQESQGASAYIAILRLILGTVYLSTESGVNINTESGDKIIIDY